MLNIGGQTVRLATPGGTLLKAGSTLTGKEWLVKTFQIILIIEIWKKCISIHQNKSEK